MEIIITIFVNNHHFKDIFIRVAQGLVTHNSQSDVTIGELREKYSDKMTFFDFIAGIFSRKK